MSNLHQFNPGRKSWKMYANTITSISGDDLTISPYDGKNIILEVSGNNEIIFKQGDTSYNLADLSNVASGGGGGASNINGLNDGLVVNTSSYFIGGGGSSVTTNATNNTFYGYNSGNVITDGFQNVGIGSNSLYTNTTGYSNVAIGYEAGKLSTSGENNIFIGYQSGINVTTGGYNVAVGTNTLKGISDKWSQTAIGYNCLSHASLTGNENTGVGAYVLQANTSGRSNAVLGAYAKMNNTTGHSSVAVGYASARFNTTGYENVFVGFNSCRNGTSGFHNVYIGFDSAYYTNGNYNVNVGTQSGKNNSSATKNTGLGYRSLFGGGGGTGGSENTALGYQSSKSITSGIQNTSVGANSLYSITTGNYNVALGYDAAKSMTTGDKSIAIGYKSLYSLQAGQTISIGYYSMYNTTTGGPNHTLGNSSLYNNTTGMWNIAIGEYSLYYNTTGDKSIAIGDGALTYNTYSQNIAFGYEAMGYYKYGVHNIAIGINALSSSSSTNGNTIGEYNLAFGTQSLTSNTTGSNNVAIGYQSLNSNTTGYHNVAVGHIAGNNTTTGYKNVYIGYNCYGGATNNNEIAIGSDVIGSGTNTVTIGTNDNIAHYLGKALIGNVGHNSNYAGFSYRGLDSSSYALLQDNNGETRINAKTGQIIYFFINNNPNNGFTFNGSTLDMNNKTIQNVENLYTNNIDVNAKLKLTSTGEILIGATQDAGSSGQFLKSNGSGNSVSWGTPTTEIPNGTRLGNFTNAGYGSQGTTTRRWEISSYASFTSSTNYDHRLIFTYIPYNASQQWRTAAECYIGAGYNDRYNLFSRLNFTGQHRCIVNTNINNNHLGLIVSTTGKYLNMDNNNKPTINDSLPICNLTTLENDKKVFGVISDMEDEERKYSAGSFITPVEKENINENRFYINSVGEGSIWVCNKNGNLENGDYISSSNILGYGQKQILLEDCLTKFTVAKITCDCNFSLNKQIKKKVKTTIVDNEKRLEYDTNGDVIFENDLDSSGNPIYDYEYETRFLDENANILSGKEEYLSKLNNGENVYIANFVGCSYHCG